MIDREAATPLSSLRTVAAAPVASPTPSTVAAAPTRVPTSPHTRRWRWVAALAILLALLLTLPPLFNVNRYRRQIAATMTASLGRPVHLDNVSLHLLPVPGFTLSNLVVSEDPAFGDEPTVRANTVEATLRLSSLWHRPVEFSTVRFIEPSVNLVRNAEGRWNLSDVLLHTSKTNVAPTCQSQTRLQQTSVLADRSRLRSLAALT